MTLQKILTVPRSVLFSLALAFAACVAQAQTYPNWPNTFVYAYPAASSTDVAWRAVVQEASRGLGLDIVMRAKPDGYTIGGYSNAQLVVMLLIDPKLAIEPGNDYVSLVLGLETYLLMVARADAPFKDVKGLIAYAKANPGKINAGSPGAGAGSHLGLAMVSTQAGIEYTHIPYKGAAPALHAMLAGEFDVMFTDLLAKPYIDSGRMVGLGVSGSTRWDLFPGMPALQDAGLGGFPSLSGSGVMAPPGIPEDVAARLNRAFNETFPAPEVRARLEATGRILRGGTMQEAPSLIRADIERYRPVIKTADI
jgi:tripartite-type tricarboxylate transporter receptor subunit TctC